jgi:exonuclease VII small subunit
MSQETQNYQRYFDSLKQIAEKFKNTDKLTLDEIESDFKVAHNAFKICDERIKQVENLIKNAN